MNAHETALYAPSGSLCFLFGWDHCTSSFRCHWGSSCRDHGTVGPLPQQLESDHFSRMIIWRHQTTPALWRTLEVKAAFKRHFMSLSKPVELRAPMAQNWLPVVMVQLWFWKMFIKEWHVRLISIQITKINSQRPPEWKHPLSVCFASEKLGHACGWFSWAAF